MRILQRATVLINRKGCGTGSAVYSPYPRRLESLTICECNHQVSTFSLVWSGRVKVTTSAWQPGATGARCAFEMSQSISFTQGAASAGTGVTKETKDRMIMIMIIITIMVY